ncbi:MAG TPA: acyltransferase [Rugosimonospora sp.]
MALRRFPALDGLRAIAALMVIAFHYDGRVDWLSGWIGVQVFFVLSGFLITTLMLREEARDATISLKKFYLRRVFRIMPVYFVLLAASTAISTRNTGYHSLHISAAMPYYVSFFNEFAPSSILFHTWTIGIEQKFYLVWPLIAFTALALKRARAALTAVLAFGVLAIEPLFAPSNSADPFLPYGVLLLGCLVAIVMNNPKGFSALSFLTRPAVALAVALCFVGVHLGVARLTTTLNSQRIISIYAIAVAVLLPSLLGTGLPGRLLALAPMRFIGARSYSLYLVQSLAAHAAGGLLVVGGHSRFVLVAVIALALADVLYRWVELPMIKVGRRFCETRKPPGSVPPAPPVPPGAPPWPAPGIEPAVTGPPRPRAAAGSPKPLAFEPTLGGIVDG